jgi:hypothetical protein
MKSKKILVFSAVIVLVGGVLGSRLPSKASDSAPNKHVCGDVDKATANFIHACEVNRAMGANETGKKYVKDNGCRCLAENFNVQDGADSKCEFDYGLIMRFLVSDRAKAKCDL